MPLTRYRFRFGARRIVRRRFRRGTGYSRYRSSRVVARRYPRPYKRCVHRFKPESKFYDATAAGGGIGQNPAGWSRYDLSCPITQGTSSVTRIGAEIVARSIGITFDVTRNASGATAQRFRYMLLCYKESEGSIPTAGEFFQTTNVFFPQRNLEWITAFRVITDRTLTLDSAITNQKTIRIRRRLNFKMKYQDNSGTTGGQTMNQLFFFIWSDQASNPPSLNNFSWRLTFNDN